MYDNHIQTEKFDTVNGKPMHDSWPWATDPHTGEGIPGQYPDGSTPWD